MLCVSIMGKVAHICFKRCQCQWVFFRITLLNNHGRFSWSLFRFLLKTSSFPNQNTFLSLFCSCQMLLNNLGRSSWLWHQRCFVLLFHNHQKTSTFRNLNTFFEMLCFEKIMLRCKGLLPGPFWDGSLSSLLHLLQLPSSVSACFRHV